jgi:uncharacterized membrane protein
MICICSLAGAYTYRVRARKRKNKIVVAHTSYVIKTFWRSCILLLITGFVSLLYILVMIDYAPLEECAKPMILAFNNGSLKTLQKVLGACGELFAVKNNINLQVAAFIAFSPVFLYVLLRCVRGSMLLAFSKTQLNGESALKKTQNKKADT